MLPSVICGLLLVVSTGCQPSPEQQRLDAFAKRKLARQKLAQQKREAEESSPYPRLWTSDEDKELKDSVGGGGDLDIYRWTNGILDGWIQFEDSGKGNFVQFDLDKYVEPRTVRSGIVTIRKTSVKSDESDDYNWMNCEIRIVANCERQLNSDNGQDQVVIVYSGRIKGDKRKEPVKLGKSAVESLDAVAQKADDEIFFFGKSGDGIRKTFRKGTFNASTKTNDEKNWLVLNVLTHSQYEKLKANKGVKP